MRTSAVLLFLLCGLAPVTVLGANPPEARYREIDSGSFIIRLNDRVVGAERFGIEARSDSVNCLARSYRTQRTANGEEEIQKTGGIAFRRSDWALIYYQSEETFRGETLTRGIVYDPSDTALTVYRERKDGPGSATRIVAPPGRLFVLDSGLYTLFDVMCVYLHGQTFTRRPLNILTFSERDTVVEAEIADIGPETIRWGARPVVTRRLEFRQGGTVFRLWVDPAGRMLRLAHEPTGLRVERDPPPVKKRAAPAPKPGG